MKCEVDMLNKCSWMVWDVIKKKMEKGMSLITMTDIQILLGCQYKLNIKHNMLVKLLFSI